MPHQASYFRRLARALDGFNEQPVALLAEQIRENWRRGRSVWICGNGGSAANAVHWANDFLYPVAKTRPRGVRLHALAANSSVITCLGNDVGYENVYARQLASFAEAGDLLVVLSGSGNSPNIIRALDTARDLAVKSWAIVGFDGGKAKQIADAVIHIETDDMQIAEDMQMAVCHSLVQQLADQV